LISWAKASCLPAFEDAGAAVLGAADGVRRGARAARAPPGPDANLVRARPLPHPTRAARGTRRTPALPAAQSGSDGMCGGADRPGARRLAVRGSSSGRGIVLTAIWTVNRQVEQPKECRFSPYQNNGGTCLAIAGKDFCIVAADSRLSLGYSILSRTSPKVAQLTSKCCMASSGCQADMITLQKFLKFRMQVRSVLIVAARPSGRPCVCSRSSLVIRVC